MESRKSLVAGLVAVICDESSGEPSGKPLGDSTGGLSDDRDFFKRCGLRPMPQLIRMRILDPGLRSRFGGLGDISAPVEEAAGFDITPATVFIIEEQYLGTTCPSGTRADSLGYRMECDSDANLMQV